MKHFIIITNRPKDPDLEITRRVQELLKLRQASCSVYADEIPKEEWKRILLREGDRTDAILVLGGDGTMLRAADEIIIRIIGKAGREETGIEACFDGARNVELAPLDEVRVTKSIKTTSIIKISEAGFLDVLHRKMSD